MQEEPLSLSPHLVCVFGGTCVRVRAQEQSPIASVITQSFNKLLLTISVGKEVERRG